MAGKCSFQDSGYCKYKRKCNFKHFEHVCKDPKCKNRDCNKRHPQPCKHFFLRKFCRFGSECMYDHNLCCEDCDNLTFLIKKETKKSEEATKNYEIISKLKYLKQRMKSKT